MKEDNLIIKAYRNEDNPDTIEIDVKGNVYGYELYRISLSLLDKFMRLNPNKEVTSEEEIKDFFNGLAENYIKYYQ